MMQFEGLFWPETDVRDYASVECPCSEFVGSLAGRAARYCAGDYVNGAYWQSTADYSMCAAKNSIITGTLCEAAAVCDQGFISTLS